MSVMIKQLDYSESDFQSELDKALAWDSISDQSVQESVSTIIADVRSRGDEAVVEWTNKLDGLSVDKVSALEISKDELQESLKKIPSEQAAALENAAARIRRYHEKQRQGSWDYTDADGSVFGQKVTPIDRVGMYVPGGKAFTEHLEADHHVGVDNLAHAPTDTRRDTPRQELGILLDIGDNGEKLLGRKGKDALFRVSWH